MFFDFRTKTSVSIVLYASLYSTFKICVDKPKESLKTQFICQLSLIFVVSYSHADSVAVRSNHFLLVEWLFEAKVLPTGHAVAQNSVFVVSQPKTTKNNSHHFLIKHVKETIVMKILQQFRSNVNYMA